MKKNYLFKTAAMLAVPALALTACSDDNDGPEAGITDGAAADGMFIIATQTAGSGGTTDALVAAASLDEGSVSATDNPDALKNDGATQWIFYKNFCYALTYNQGNAGTTRSYILDEKGKIRQRDVVYRINSFSSYGMYDDYILTMKSAEGTTGADAAGHYPMTLSVTYLNVLTEQKTENNVADGLYSVENFLGNGEYVTLAGAEQSGTRLYCGVIPMGLSQYGCADGNGKWVLPGNEGLVKKQDGGQGSGAYKAGTLNGTQYPDECWVAIYPDASFKNPKIAHTDRISYPAGRFRSQYYQTVWAAANGDIYVFSPSYARTQTEAAQQSTLHAGVCRIPAGSDDFDSYYVDLEAELGTSFLRCWPAGGNSFILQTYDEPYGPSFTGNAHGLAIFNADTRTVTKVSGLPASVTTIGKTVFVQNGFVYATVTQTDGNPVVYRIDPATAVAQKGLEIRANDVTGFGYLTRRL